MIAVLRDALDCIEKYRFSTEPPGRRIFDEATQWLLANDTDWPYSFQGICGALELDPGAVLRQLGVAPVEQVEAFNDIPASEPR